MSGDRVSRSRRGFLKMTAAVAGASALPEWFVRECAAEPAEPTAKSKADEPRIGIIGCGGQGMADADARPSFGKLVAVCDVDATHLDDARKKYPGAEGYADFRKLLERKDVDVVVCGTVDHWHTLVAMAAMKAGKDVYCEKPLTLTIDEGRRLVGVERQTKASSRPARNSGVTPVSGWRATWCVMAGSARWSASKYGYRPVCAPGRSRARPCPRASITISGWVRRPRWIT
jgi:hypothetical protein